MGKTNSEEKRQKMKKLVCAECNSDIGEMEKGKIKIGVVCLCSTCNYNRLVAKNNQPKQEPETNNNFVNFFNDVLDGKIK